MSVQIKYKTQVRHISERTKRRHWLTERIPSDEFLIEVQSCPDIDGWDPDDRIETTVTIWADDAEKIATEFWFKFP